MKDNLWCIECFTGESKFRPATFIVNGQSMCQKHNDTLSDEEKEEEGFEEFDEEDSQQKLDGATSEWSEGVSELEDLQGEYNEWEDNLPESFQGGNSPVSEKLQEIINLGFETVEFTLENVGGDISDAEGYKDEYAYVDLPLGFGRD